jgi:putative ATP-dependent endonuclease of the OLD family
MYISKLTIRNYRNFQNEIFTFKKGINTLIGENGSGKTNLFNAIRLVLDENLPRNVKYLKDTDFNRSIGSWKGHWIIINVEFEDLTNDDKIQCLATHFVGTLGRKGNFNFYFRPNEKTRQILFDFSNLDAADKTATNFKTLIDKISIDDYEPMFTSKAKNINFSNNDFYKTHIGDFVNYVFPNPSDKCLDELGVFNRSFTIYDEISCTYADALRDVVSDLRLYKSNPLIALLSEYEKAIDDTEKEAVETLVTSLNNKISGLDKVKELSGEIKKKITDTVGKTYSPTIEITSNLPNDTVDLFKKLTLRVGENIGEPTSSIEELSLGGANLVFLSLKLLSYQMQLPKNKASYLLLIEEPEAHLHTHIQKTIFQNIGKEKAQVIYSTHSTHISEVCKINSVNILTKKNNFTQVSQPINGLSSDEIIHLERYLDASRNTLLFAKSVIMVEGDAEFFVLPTLIKEVFGIMPDELGLSIINTGSTGFKNIANIFHDNRIKKRCAIVTDEDKSITGVSNEAEVRGAYRKTDLISFSNGNTYVQPYFGEYTFEVELIKSGNSSYFKPIIEKSYVGAHHRTISAKSKHLTNIDSSDVNEYGHAALQIAEREQKGWFALQLCNKIDYKFIIPEYILKAIGFCIKDTISLVERNMVEYRINKGKSDIQNPNQPIFQTLFAEINAPDLVETYKLQLPNDQLTKLLSFV